MNRDKSKPAGKSCLARFLIGLVILACLVPVAGLGLWGIGGMLIVADPLEKADVVVVLSGNEKDRLAETLRILREGYAPLVLLTETEDLAGGGSSMSTIDKVVTARNLGIASEAILVTKRTATSTRDEGLAVLEVAQQREFDKLIVVTDPYHCLRTRLLFRSIFRGSGIDVSVRPIRDHWYRSYNWWLSAEGRRATLSEMTKLFFFMLGLRGD